MNARMLGLALAASLLMGGCGSDVDDEPTFGDGSEPAGASAAELTDLKADAKIEDCPASDQQPPAAGGLPDLDLDCLGGGRAVRLSGLTGKPSVINLWASWCKECRDELPLLARAHREYGDQVQFLGIDVNDSAPEAALRLARLAGVTYPQLVDRDVRVRAPLRVTGIPQTVFVDARGRMVFTERAPFRSYADVTAAIRQHLGVTS